MNYFRNTSQHIQPAVESVLANSTTALDSFDSAWNGWKPWTNSGEAFTSSTSAGPDSNTSSSSGSSSDQENN